MRGEFLVGFPVSDPFEPKYKCVLRSETGKDIRTLFASLGQKCSHQGRTSEPLKSLVIYHS